MEGIRIREYHRDDAIATMTMWRETAHMWPMGAPYPTGVSPEEFHNRVISSGALKHWIAEDMESGIIAGYCSFSKDSVVPEHMEVSLLNTHPRWQGQGIGKAMLMKCIETTARMGNPALFLGTWPGNEKACGLYKRLGFFHKPETDIGFVNFIPSVIQCPLLKSYLNESNWYSTLKRDTTYGPDIHHDGKMQVFPYRFETDQGVIKTGFERYSNGLYRIETPEGIIELKTDFDKGWKGLHRTFEIHGDSHFCKSAAVIATTNGKHGLDIQQEFHLESGAESLDRKLSVMVPVDLDLEQPESPCLELELKSSSGQSLATLCCGFKAVEPITLEFPEFTMFAPAKTSVQRWINVTNNLNKAIELEYSIESTDDIDVTPHHFVLELEPDETRAVELQICGEPGSYELKFKGNGAGKNGLKLPEQSLSVGLIGADRPARARKGSSVLVSNAHYVFILNQQRGSMYLISRTDERCGIGAQTAAAGPPYPNFGTDGVSRFDVRSSGSDISITTTTPSRTFKGLTVIHELYLNASPLVIMKTRLISDGHSGKGIKLKQQITECSYMRDMIIPVGSHMFCSNTNGPNNCETTLSSKEYLSTEAWLSQDGRGSVAGCFWPVRPRDMSFGAYFAATVHQSAENLAIDSPVEMPDVIFYAGSGHPGTIRRLWSFFQDADVRISRRKHVIDSVAKTLLLHPEQDELHIELESILNKEDSVFLELEDCSIVNDCDSRIKVSGLGNSVNRIASVPVDAARARPGVEEVNGTVSHSNWEHPFRVPVIIMGSTKAEYSKEKRGRYSIHTLSNGPLTVDLAPGYHGQVISMRWDGRETLHSKFPGSGLLGFEKPFFGGVTPVYETRHRGINTWFKGDVKQVCETDQFGIQWLGIQMKNRHFPHKMTRDLKFSCKYCVGVDWPVFRCVVEMKNCSGRFERGNLMSIVAPIMPDNETENVTVRYTVKGEERAYRRQNVGSSLIFDNWFTYEYSGKQPDFHLACLQDSRFESDVIDTGEGDVYAYINNTTPVKPGSVQRLEFLISYGDVGQGLRLLLNQA